jgi:hypothetical protein
MAAANPAIPPLPPDVQQQQGGQNPLAQYAEGAQSSPGQQAQVNGKDLIDQLLNEISERLNKIAQVSQMTEPTYIEYVKKMSQVGAAFQKEVQSSKQNQSQGAGAKAGLEPARANSQEGATNAVAA